MSECQKSLFYISIPSVFLKASFPVIQGATQGLTTHWTICLEIPYFLSYTHTRLSQIILFPVKKNLNFPTAVLLKQIDDLRHRLKFLSRLDLSSISRRNGLDIVFLNVYSKLDLLFTFLFCVIFIKNLFTAA